MATYEEILALARGLGAEERQRLAVELVSAPRPGGTELRTFGGGPPAPHSVAWLKAERGHAVLATDTGPAESDIPAGAEAISGMWGDVRSEQG